jgi:hypothetical protein
MRTRTRIHPYVTPELARRLVGYSAAKGLTESAAVQAALEEYLDGKEKDSAVIIRRLDRLGRAAVRQQRDVEVLSEAFALFVQIWSAYRSELSDAEKEAATRRGAKFYREYLKYLSQQLASDSRFVKLVVNDQGEPPNAGQLGRENAAGGPAR